MVKRPRVLCVVDQVEPVQAVCGFFDPPLIFAPAALRSASVLRLDLVRLEKGLGKHVNDRGSNRQPRW